MAGRLLSGVSGVVFDWDGVLLDSLGAGLNVYNKIFERIGARRMTLDEYLRVQSPNWYEFYRRVGVPEELWPEIDEEWVRLYEGEHPGLHSDAMGCLRSLREAGFRLAVVSNGSKSRIMEEMARLGVGPFFESVSFGEKREELKPSPVMLERTLSVLGLRSQQTVYVGDSPADIQAAKNAEVRSVAIARGPIQERRLRSESPDFVFRDLSSLSDFLTGPRRPVAPHP